MDKQKLIDELNAEPLRRMGRIKAVEKEDGQRSFTLSFSSETEEVVRSFGIEVLGHRAEEVDLEFLASGRAPLLKDHDPAQQIGVVDTATISDARGRASIRFGAGALAQEMRQDVIDGIRGNVSVGYSVEDAEPLLRDGKEVGYRITRWRPHELSLVSIPADTSVGVGRKKSETETKKTERVIIMSEDKKVPAVDHTDAVNAERERIAEISRLGRGHKLDQEADAAIRGGATVAEFQAEVLRKLEAGHTPLHRDPESLSKQEKKDVQRFSFLKAIDGKLTGTLDGVEREMHQEAVKEARAAGHSVSGLGVPFFLLNRDLTVGGGDTGDKLVDTVLEAGSFIDVLRNAMVLRQLGVRYLDGLSSSVAIPRKTAASSAAWEGETDANAETTPTFDQVTLAPKRVGCFTDYSKQFFLQSSLGAEQMLRDDIAQTLGLAIEAAAINGGGSGEPSGILQASGLGDVAHGTDGGVATFGTVIDLETDVSVANADMGSLAYLTTPGVRGLLKQTDIGTDTGRMVWNGTEVNGYNAVVSGSVPSALTKGSSDDCHALIFGNFRDLLIGTWGGLDLLVDQYTQATSAVVRIVANMYTDVAIRHDASFSAAQDVTLS